MGVGRIFITGGAAGVAVVGGSEAVFGGANVFGGAHVFDDASGHTTWLPWSRAVPQGCVERWSEAIGMAFGATRGSTP